MEIKLVLKVVIALSPIPENKMTDAINAYAGSGRFFIINSQFDPAKFIAFERHRSEWRQGRTIRQNMIIFRLHSG